MGLALAVAAGFALATAAECAPVQATVAEKVVSSDRFPKLTATYPGGVTAHPDLV
ncbi:hypothetical protein [Phenylobacterium sp. J367]|uniref:hypothetical protein n=1 Tax=Phenylobacterium sp. J367 TaxID=2898435 RepID=UPI002150A1FD|nr:hypothetical protein [Phenylobacterium sp. J367]MCR5879997.1 hypothetical protein [Phenylobacterium sp. J367]